MEITGKIRVINLEHVVSDSFKKRELVVTTDEQYPQHIIMEFTQDKCAILDGYKVGEDVKVSINLRGREWVNPQGETRFFNTIQAWRIERQVDGQQAPPLQPEPNQSAVDAYNAKNNPQGMPANDDEPDDLPF